MLSGIFWEDRRSWEFLPNDKQREKITTTATQGKFKSHPNTGIVLNTGVSLHSLDTISIYSEVMHSVTLS